MHIQFRTALLCLLAVLGLALHAAPLPLVSPIFGDRMVLQQGKPNPVWGWSTPGQAVQVTIGTQTATATAGPDGRWQAEIQPPPTGGPYELKITAGTNTVACEDVLVGEVWLCGGQSNMAFVLGHAEHGAEEVAAAKHPEIRLFTVQNHVAYTAAAIPAGTWKPCSPQTVATNGGFSAVAYFFGRKLQNELHVPIGLIQDCIGGTPAESWMNPVSLHELKDFDVPLAEIDRLHARGGPEYGSFLMHWLDEYDVGNNLWFAPGLDDSKWKPVTLPGNFHELGVGAEPCVVWFRKTLTLPDPLPAGHATVLLGVVDKMDTTYLNGHFVGASSWVENPRAYAVEDGVLHPGKNLLAIRVVRTKSPGGFMAKPDGLRLVLGDHTVIPLAGEWSGALSVDVLPPIKLPLTYENYPTMPGVLFNGMIQPLAPLALRGAIWYQGEANCGRAHQYRTLLPGLINGWRRAFGQGDFPFYIVSLPKFSHHRDQPGPDGWAELRDAQLQTALTVTNTGLAVTIDTGDADNIHPKTKLPVGERLALCALAGTYGKNIPASGPIFTCAETVGTTIKLHFTHTDGGLVVHGPALKEFSLADSDRKWHWAEARIEGDTVIVSSAAVPAPAAARYAWQSNPAATLFNGAGLPAAPFRTDHWPDSTENQKPW